MQSANLFEGAPKFLTTRFSSISKYVSETLIPESTIRQKTLKYRTKDEKLEEQNRLKLVANEASIVTFIFLTYKFFKEGSNAAKQAADTFNELGVEGFYIGRTYFSERNENVIKGEVIAERLLNSISNEEIKDLVKNSQYIYEILNIYKRQI